jgi:hypothetical protein
MKSKWLSRLPFLYGAIFPIFAFSSGPGDSAAPTRASSGQQIAAWAFHHQLTSRDFRIGVELWAFVSVMVFTIVLYSRLRPAEPKTAIGAQVAVAAAVMAIAIKLASFPASYALYSSPVQLDPGLARALYAIGDYSFFVSMLIQSLSLGAVAVSGLLHHGIPRWLAATAGVIAVAMVLGYTFDNGGSFQVAPTLAWFLWLAVASVTLFVQGPRAVSPPRPTPDESIVQKGGIESSANV